MGLEPIAGSTGRNPGENSSASPRTLTHKHSHTMGSIGTQWNQYCNVHLSAIKMCVVQMMWWQWSASTVRKRCDDVLQWTLLTQRCHWLSVTCFLGMAQSNNLTGLIIFISFFVPTPINPDFAVAQWWRSGLHCCLTPQRLPFDSLAQLHVYALRP